MKKAWMYGIAMATLLGMFGCASDTLAEIRVKIETDLTEYVADVVTERIESNEKLSDVQKAGMKETVSNLEAEILAKIEQIYTVTQTEE